MILNHKIDSYYLGFFIFISGLSRSQKKRRWGVPRGVGGGVFCGTNVELEAWFTPQKRCLLNFVELKKI